MYYYLLSLPLLRVSSIWICQENATKHMICRRRGIDDDAVYMQTVRDRDVEARMWRRGLGVGRSRPSGGGNQVAEGFLGFLPASSLETTVWVDDYACQI